MLSIFLILNYISLLLEKVIEFEIMLIIVLMTQINFLSVLSVLNSIIFLF